MNFEDVIVSDGMAWSLFGQAGKERLLYVAPGVDTTIRPPSPSVRQAVLALLVLFDKLTVHDLSSDGVQFRIPSLESEGIVDIVAAGEPRTRTKPIETRWTPSKADPRPKAGTALRRSLVLVNEYRPLVVSRLMSRPNEFATVVSKTLQISRRRYYNDLLDLATAYIAGDTARVKETLLARSLPKDLFREITREMFDFEHRGKDNIGPTNVSLLIALIAANEIGAVAEISAERGIGVASLYYGNIGRPLPSADAATFASEVSSVSRTFSLIRSVLHEEGRFFPRIESVQHALTLRKDPHLSAFREQLKRFHEQLSAGDPQGIVKVRAEVRKARRILERARSWELALRWITYMSLPAGLAESIMGAPPVVGTSLGIASVLGTASSTRAVTKSQWALFGR